LGNKVTRDPTIMPLRRVRNDYCYWQLSIDL